MLWTNYVQVQLQRYLEPRGHVVRASDRLDWLLYKLDDSRFKQEIRIPRECFQELLMHIENHTIFQNNSNNRQRPVHHQLLVALKRFGCFGNGAAIGNIARVFGLSGNVLRPSYFLRFYRIRGSEASSFQCFYVRVCIIIRRCRRAVHRPLHHRHSVVGEAGRFLAGGGGTTRY
jgi:hypothetical protein